MADDQVLACPECDSSQVSTGSRSGFRERVEERYRYRCWECTATFDDPVVREKYHTPLLRGNSLAARLDEMEADNV